MKTGFPIENNGISVSYGKFRERSDWEMAIAEADYREWGWWYLWLISLAINIRAYRGFLCVVLNPKEWVCPSLLKAMNPPTHLLEYWKGFTQLTRLGLQCPVFPPLVSPCFLLTGQQAWIQNQRAQSSYFMSLIPFAFFISWKSGAIEEKAVKWEWKVLAK